MSMTHEKKREEPPVEFKDYPGPDDRQIALDEKKRPARKDAVPPQNEPVDPVEEQKR